MMNRYIHKSGQRDLSRDGRDPGNRQDIHLKGAHQSDKICITNLLNTSRSSWIVNHQQLVHLLLVALLAIHLTASQFALAADSLQSTLVKLKISPDIIPIPSYTETIRVELNGNVVKPGDVVPARNFKDLKNDKISWSVSSHDARHTILLLDLDRKIGSQPSNQTQIYNQFTSINLPGAEINAGQTIVAFEPPVVPCSPSTKHRILMIALHQDQHIDLAEITYIAAASGSGDTRKRENFNLDQFIKRHRLTVTAANAFQAAGEINGVCSGSLGSIIVSAVASRWLILGAMLSAMLVSPFNGITKIAIN